MSRPHLAGDSKLDLIEYPSRFALKLIGHKAPDFEDLVLQLVQRRCPQSEIIEVSKRKSRGEKYIALTLGFTVYSRLQLEQIYRDLYDCKAVVMSF